jgi:hypothetical protein
MVESKRELRRACRVGLLALLVLAVTGAPLAVAGVAPARAAGATVGRSLHNDTSQALRSTPPTRAPETLDEVPEPGPLPRPKAPVHPALPSPASGALMPAPSQNFLGQGVGLSTVRSAPPDTNGAVGPNHYVQVVNATIAIFDKAGGVMLAPTALNTLWSGFGGLCQTDNDGDPVVRYDRLADRWVILQFAIRGADGGATPYLMCVAVSTSGDPTGAYYRYSLAYSSLPDYPKLGVWPDAFYLTVNLFNSARAFVGAQVSALDRGAMLSGVPATWESFTLTQSAGLLPADLDSARPPPAGSPDYMVGLGRMVNSLDAFRFHADFVNPANATLSGPFSLAVSPFSGTCGGARTCVPQGGTTQQLDSLEDRLMFRLAYRNFGDHESLVASHSVMTSGGGAIRWYELRVSSPSGWPAVYQQGTHAPDSQFRWMPSIAMDGSGDIAVGYSVSSPSTFPSVNFGGRLAGDALGTLGQSEGQIMAGGGSQINGLSRWGDYSAMVTDPADDCTFWYTTEYLGGTGSFNWSTRIASFRFPSCGVSDFSISASPGGQYAAPGGSAAYTVSTAVTVGVPVSVSLGASGLPAGASASFAPGSVSSGAASTMTVQTASTTPLGTSTVTVTGTGPATSHSTTVSLTVTPTGAPVLVNGGFETGDLSGWSATGRQPPVVVRGPVHSGTYAAVVGSGIPAKANSSLTQTVAIPAWATTLSFWYLPHCPDTIRYDQEQVQVRSVSGAILATALNTCSSSSTWTPVSFDVRPFAGQTVVLYFNVHDDGYPTDPTYMFVDDIAIT